MFANIRNRVTVKKAAVILTFALVITGSGLSSLASLSDTLNDTIVFNALSVDLKSGTSDTASITFQNVDTSVDGTFGQDIDLNNSGSASASVSLATSVSDGAGSDLDSAIVAAVLDGTCANPTAPIVITPGPWRAIADVDTNFPVITLNAGQHRPVCIQFSLTGGDIVASSLTALFSFTATHP